jgi:hypothetical protein
VEKLKDSADKNENKNLVSKKRKPVQAVPKVVEEIKEKSQKVEKIADLESFLQDNSEVLSKITQEKLLKYMFYKKYQYVTSKYQQIEINSIY